MRKLLIFGVLFLWMTAGLQSFAQQNPGMPNAQQRVPGQPNAPEPGEQEKEAQKQMMKEANRQRQADLKKDTDRLLTLATELKKYVDESNENTLSLDVIKKADEIERLAHDVQKKMRSN